jgi:hypothetical protein
MVLVIFFLPEGVLGWLVRKAKERPIDESEARC